MGGKNQLRTVRFSAMEGKMIDGYLKENQIFESFSALARIATLTFLKHPWTLHLKPIGDPTTEKRPSFLWDYPLSEIEVREILSEKGFSDQKLWLIARLLSEARFEEVMDYLTVGQIQKALPLLRLDPKVKERWSYATKLWSHHE